MSTGIQRLRNSLCTVFDQLNSGDIQVDVAREMVNASRQIIKSCMAELEHSRQRQERPAIDYICLDDEKAEGA